MADNDDNVWISREEYERLQEYVQYVQKQSPQTYVAPHSYEQSYVQTGGSYKVKPAQIVAGVPLAICFVISLSSPTKPILWTITIVLFSIYVLMVYYDYFQTKKAGYAKGGSGKYWTFFGILIGTVVLAPVLFIGIMVVMLFTAPPTQGS